MTNIPRPPRGRRQKHYFIMPANYPLPRDYALPLVSTQPPDPHRKPGPRRQRWRVREAKLQPVRHLRQTSTNTNTIPFFFFFFSCTVVVPISRRCVPVGNGSTIHSGNRRYCAYCHCWKFSSVPINFTDALAGDRYYSAGAITGPTTVNIQPRHLRQTTTAISTRFRFMKG